jgi:uncharacterized protein (DUF1697 family)
MADLRAMLEGLGYHGVRTLLQSGNAVFTSDQPRAKIGPAIEAAIEAKTGFRPRVLLRTAAELRAVLKAAPDWDDANPSRVVVTFLEDDPHPDGVKAILSYEGPESVTFRGREMWAHHPNGISQSELAKMPAKKLLKTELTGRNLNTVRALAEMTAALEP